jgi:hypothetical protein
MRSRNRVEFVEIRLVGGRQRSIDALPVLDVGCIREIVQREAVAPELTVDPIDKERVVAGPGKVKEAGIADVE